MKFLKLTATFLMCGIMANAIAQPVKNYDANGRVYKSTADFLSGTGSDKTKTEAKAFPVALVPVVIGAGISIYNTLKEKKQASYTGVYSNTFSFKHIPKRIKIERIMLKDKRNGASYEYETLDPVAATFELEVVKSSDGITLQLYAGSLKRSKACFKKGERLAITMAIKLIGTGEDGSGGIDLGEANIIIPIIYVREEAYDFLAVNLEKYISKANFLPLPPKSDLLPVSMTVKITEVNLDKVNPTVVESILKSNGSDLTDVLKGILGVE